MIAILLSLQRLPLTTPVRFRRLLCLEHHVRQSSEGQFKIQDYREWLDHDGLPVPESRQVLHDDFAFYSDFCDDLEYGGRSKWLKLNSAPDEDALKWFMGASWARSPVRPRLSSSVTRCLLDALHFEREVQFLYAKRDQLGHGIARAEGWRVIPHHLVPGIDSAYMSMWLHSGKLATFNLARIIGRVRQTGHGKARYGTAQYDEAKTYAIQHPDAMLLTKLDTQYRGFTRTSAHCLETQLRPDEQYFLESIVPNWMDRITAELSTLSHHFDEDAMQ